MIRHSRLRVRNLGFREFEVSLLSVAGVKDLGFGRGGVVLRLRG